MKPLKRVAGRLLAGSILSMTALVAPTGAQAALSLVEVTVGADVHKMVYDSATNLTWVANAAMSGTGLSWQQANAWAANLSYGGKDDWRLPTVRPSGASFGYAFATNGSTDVGLNITSASSELSHLFYVSLGNPAYNFSNPAASPRSAGPFTSMPLFSYWTGTVYVGPNTQGAGPFAWTFETLFGTQSFNEQTAVNYYAWAVRDGNVMAPVPEPAEWVMMCAGLGVVTAIARRRRKTAG